MRKKIIFLFLTIFFSLSCIFPQTSGVKLSPAESDNLKQAAEAYKNEDWTTAVFFLRRLVTIPGGSNDEIYLMLIKSEVYSGEYNQAFLDCEYFLKQFYFSPYAEYIQYQRGRLLHFLSRNEDSVIALSDFCHKNPDSELYPFAIFWIAECFYDEYNFDTARSLYLRIVKDFPSCEKTSQSQYKLDLIERRSREEKLLYLLKVVGEENLSTREEYERQLRIYAIEDEREIKKSLLDAQNRISELENQLESEIENPAVQETEIVENVSSAEVENTDLPPELDNLVISKNDEKYNNASSEITILALKRKAKKLKYLLEEKTEEGEK